MNDLIRRQDAIDAIKEFKHGAAEWKDEQEEHSDIWHRADSAIASAIEIGLRVKKIPSAQQWIPVEEETPILPNIVLVCDSLGKILFDSYIDGSWTYCPYVVAWMPLPSPYREETES